MRSFGTRSARKRPKLSSVLILTFVSTGVCSAAAQDAPKPPDSTPVLKEIMIHEVLVIGQVGRFGRSSVHTDAVEAQLVAGTWSPPTAGQTLELPDGTTRTWAPVSAGDDGWIRHQALEGGYAYAAVSSDHEQAMLLDASSHSLVYVNGQPRAGDPYQWGFVRLPVLLKGGTNHLLFVCGRRELRAKLVQLTMPIALDAADATLPDLIVGQKAEVWAALVVRNATAQPLREAQLVARCGGESTTTLLPPIPAWGVRKIGFRIRGGGPPEPGTQDVKLALLRDKIEVDRAALQLRVRSRNETHRRTFISKIDDSVQFYAVQPQRPDADPNQMPALFLTLHGAGVDALGQVGCYSNKSWGRVVAPTNRRPFGFDWEDWGRIDALEVLALAEKSLNTDPQRTYLTGHSMGGHGAWQIGAHYPDRFAAIAPSAGWISFFSYVDAERPDPNTPIGAILRRATNPSDTRALSRNYLHHGIYVLHGEADDNVPVKEARTMREHLGTYHPNFAYYERPGAGHWWGNECLDWPPLFDFLRQNTRPATHEVRHVEFVTVNPAIAATCDWATIETQIHSLKLSKVDLQLDPNARRFSGTTENVAGLTISLKDDPLWTRAAAKFVLDPNGPLTIELDGGRLEDTPWPDDNVLRFVRKEGQWRIMTSDMKLAEASPTKSPLRAGPFKEAFQHRVQFVYGTKGTPEENACTAAKARYDAEVFWVRGNGSIDVLPDVEFDPAAEPDRGAVLYGNADTNAAWDKLLRDSPVQVARGRVRIGEREFTGDDLAVLAIHPRPGSSQALVAVVAGSGPAGMRLTERLPYFVSGVAYPDWIVIGPEMLRDGMSGVRAAGFFGSDWQLDPEQSAWRAP